MSIIDLVSRGLQSKFKEENYIPVGVKVAETPKDVELYFRNLAYYEIMNMLRRYGNEPSTS